MIIFVGLQGAGKSTFYRSRFASTHELISKDLFRHNKKPNRRQQQLLHEALEQHRSVVIDNTNPTAADRAPLIAMAQQFDATVIGYNFTTPLGVCLERNRLREGKHRVPDIALFVTAKKLQMPTYEEGFDQLFAVHVREDGQMELEASIGTGN